MTGRSVLNVVRGRPGVVALGVVVLAYVFIGGFVFGAFGTSAVASSEYEYSTTITTSTSTSTSTTTTTTPTVTKPGKGCGDKNHLHERRFECKVVIADGSAREGKAGAVASLILPVTLSGSPLSQVTVDYSTAPGSAIPGVDYLPVSGTLGFPVGTSTKAIAVLVLGDALRESNETFYVNLSNPSANAYLGYTQGLATIVNDD